MKRNEWFFWGFLVLIAAMVWTGCDNPTAEPDGTADNQETDTSVPPAVAADPGNAADAPLVPASKDVSTLSLASPVLIVFSEAAAAAVTPGANAEVNAETNHVTVTLTQADANIVVQGTCADGSITFTG
ncbi:MAG: hypothetical protein LBD79_02430, partial [Treponema sp.]|nr:hypothetical protein [Treponema sp.]